MPVKPEFKLQTLYLNVRRLTELAGEHAVAQAMTVMSFPNAPDKALANARLGACGRVLRAWLIQNWEHVEPIERLLVTNKARVGSMFMTEKDFYCRNLVIRTRPSTAPSQLTTKYEMLDRKVSLVLHAHRDHLAPGSPGEVLSGRRSSLFVVGVVTGVKAEIVEASPIFIGYCLEPSSDLLLASLAWHPEIQAERIDNFSKCGNEEFVRDPELSTLKKIPEMEIKKAIAELLGEDLVPKDWGGERSDLFSTRVFMGGNRLSTAFIFKGPAKFHSMKLSERVLN